MLEQPFTTTRTIIPTSSFRFPSLKTIHKTLMPEIILQPVYLDNWETLAMMEKSAASEVYVPYTTESEIKHYLENSKVFFIILDQAKIGSISYEIKADNSIYFDGLIVLPEYRQKGIATAAMKKVLETLKNHQALSLVVHPKNTPAILVYLKAGFIIKEWRENPFGDGEPRLFLLRTNQL